jgi:cytochrome c
MKLIVIIFTFLGLLTKGYTDVLNKPKVSNTETMKSKDSCLELGEELYLKHCSICHGRYGDGKGILYDSMSPKPTNFRNQTYTKQEHKKDLANIMEVLKKGVAQTSMGKFTHILKTKKELECTSKYVQSLKKEKN